MARVNNATGVYATLGYNFTDPNKIVQSFSANTSLVMDQFPPIIESWQARDMAANDVGGYLKNPVYNTIITIINTANSIFESANTAATNSAPNLDDEILYFGANVSSIVTIANTLITTAMSFLVHTNKVSGVTSYTTASDTNINPYYQIFVSYGKQAIYITNQTDGITDNSPILGCMTSILIGPQLNTSANTISADAITLTNGISSNTLTTGQVTQIQTNLTNLNNLLYSRQTSDVNFYGNLRTLVNNFNATKPFAGMGETETYLVNNLIGTPKLLSRINS
jgi:hypothetical protein